MLVDSLVCKTSYSESQGWWIESYDGQRSFFECQLPKKYIYIKFICSAVIDYTFRENEKQLILLFLD